MVTVKAGDMVYNEAGEPEALAQGTKVLVNGESVEYDGTSELQLPQLVVTYKLNPYTWSDGTAGSSADMELARQIECDKESGATSFITCEAMLDVTYSDSELAMTVTYVPGYQSPTYFLYPFASLYPNHQVLSDGRNLRDVPAAEWATLPEIAEKPLSFGPFVITDWQKGQSLTLAANPHYADGTGVQEVIVLFIPDTNQAVAQLLAGDVDYVEKATLAGGAEVQLVSDAHAQGNINFEIIASPTWEHIDMNMFVKQ
jgi:ABC-type transport system substrate-binding protein